MTEDPSRVAGVSGDEASTTADEAPLIAAMVATVTEATRGNFRARVPLTGSSAGPLKALGEGINALISAWRASELEARKTKRALETKVATIEAQVLTIRELSTPILQIWRGVLLLPMIGQIDETRRSDISRELLTRLAQKETTQVIIDITGVTSVDESTANHLLRLVRASRLLGARCVITGVNPAVADTFVDIGVELGELETRQTLEKALAECMERSHR
jgi:rsbT co-antagonist protein RsbR